MIDLEADSLFLYFGDDYIINDKIKVSQPTIGMVADYGEAQYFGVVHQLCAIPSDFKAMLWDIGIDWNELEPFQLFQMLSHNLTPDKTAYNAARDALNGWDPSGGALYYFNPNTATNKWIWSRPLTVVIGKHRFCKRHV